MEIISCDYCNEKSMYQSICRSNYYQIKSTSLTIGEYVSNYGYNDLTQFNINYCPNCGRNLRE